MSNSLEEAIWKQIHERSQPSLWNLYEVLLEGNLLVPVFERLKTDSIGRTDVPVICVRLSDGEGCLPVFTSVKRLLEWKQNGAKYIEMRGRALFEMANGIPEIDAIYCNYSEIKGSPKGKVSRAEFSLLAKGVLPGKE
jgi:hypothetical protein